MYAISMVPVGEGKKELLHYYPIMVSCRRWSPGQWDVEGSEGPSESDLAPLVGAGAANGMAVPDEKAGRRSLDVH